MREKPTITKLVCPHCGNEDSREILWQEWIPSTRRVVGIVNGRLVVDSSEYKDHAEGADKDELFCMVCDEAFPIPEGVEAFHDEFPDIETAEELCANRKLLKMVLG